VARALLALPVGERPSRVVSSPLRRCRETAQPLADALGVTVEIDRVGEIPTPAALDARGASRLAAPGFPGAVERYPGRSGLRGLDPRGRRGVASHPGAAVFSHFVALNAAVSVATGGEAVAAFRPDHVSVTVFDLVDGALDPGRQRPRGLHPGPVGRGAAVPREIMTVAEMTAADRAAAEAGRRRSC
jgi:broad specificity phosphatase PhoE